MNFYIQNRHFSYLSYLIFTKVRRSFYLFCQFFLNVGKDIFLDLLIYPQQIQFGGKINKANGNNLRLFLCNDIQLDHILFQKHNIPLFHFFHENVHEKEKNCTKNRKNHKKNIQHPLNRSSWSKSPFEHKQQICLMSLAF